jgi:hypothetical protein
MLQRDKGFILENKTTMRTCSFSLIICLLSCSRACFGSIEIEKVVLNGAATILYCEGFHRPGYRISIARRYLQANGKKDPVRQAADKNVKIPSTTVHTIKQKMQGLTDREEEMNVPAPESRTNVKPFNKMQPGQGNLWKKETPKELLPP